MKKLIIIGGAMGTGKTTAAEILVHTVPRSVMLDGDWCWQQGCDWDFGEENRKMVMDHILYLLSGFLHNRRMENVIFSWVLHEPATHRELLDGLAARGCRFEAYDISLLADEAALRQRLETRARQQEERWGTPRDREEEKKLIARTLERMTHYRCLDTRKIDTSNLTPRQTADQIAALAGLSAR